MADYPVDPTNAAEPTNARAAGYAAEELRALKGYIQSLGIGSLVAGIRGNQNYLINGDCRISVRGTARNTVSLADAFGGYICDRFQAFRTGNVGGLTYQQNTSRVPATAQRPFLQINRVAGDTNTANMHLTYTMETLDAIALQGQLCTLSFDVAAGANYSPFLGSTTLTVISGTGIDQNINTPFSGAVTLASVIFFSGPSLQRISVSFTVPTTATQLGFIISWAGSATAAGADDSLYFRDFLLLPGNGTFFVARPQSIEQQLCARYCRGIGLQAAGSYLGVAGQAISAVAARILVPAIVRPRARFTGIVISAAADFLVTTAAFGTQAVTALTYGASSTIEGTELSVSVAAGLAAGNYTMLLAANANANIVLTGAEL